MVSSIANDSHLLGEDDFSSEEETETEKEAIMLIQTQLGQISQLKQELLNKETEVAQFQI